jgi:hypothetical protein
MASKKDDKDYGILMAQYKNLRTKDPENAIKYLEGAMKLREQGNVSEDAVIGSAYL